MMTPLVSSNFSIMINVTLISYKAVYSKTGSLSYFPLFVLHHVAGLNPLAVSTKKKNYRYQTASCYEIDIAIQ
jgi:hypothetical protein